MKIKDFFNFIRWKNLLMLVLVQVLIKYVFFQKFNLDTFLNTTYFLILVMATILIAAGGYIINDIYDVQTDLVNKPSKVFVESKISKKVSIKLYYIFTIIGVLLGLALSYHVESIVFLGYFILTVTLLYLYAIHLKKSFLIGNIIVSFLIFLSILILPVFDLIPIINTSNEKVILFVFIVLLKIGVFAFLLTFLREIIKDIEDIIGDYKINSNTIPIAIGIESTKKIILFLSLLPMLSILYFGFQYFSINQYVLYYLLIFIIIPLLYFDKKLLSAKSKSDYHKLSNLLKYIMLLGILTIIIL